MRFLVTWKFLTNEWNNKQPLKQTAAVKTAQRFDHNLLAAFHFSLKG